PLLQVRRILVTGQNRDRAFSVHGLRQLAHDLLPAADIIGSENGEPFALRRIGIKHEDRYAAIDCLVDRVGKLVSVGGADRDTRRAGIYQLLNGFTLLLGFFFVRLPPVNFYIYAVLLAQLLRFVLSSSLSRLEDGVVVRFGHYAKYVVFSGSKSCCYRQAQKACQC